jgi:uncharacterized LabA/DUF88 family protein
MRSLKTPTPEKTIYCFIDGGYLREQFKNEAEFFFEKDKLPEFGSLELDKICPTATRTFYYDCRDSLDSAVSKKGGKLILTEEEVIFRRFRRAKNCHVKLGTLKGKGRKRRQKEVDVLIVVDLLTQAHRGNFQKAVLIAGDMDFRPALNSLVDSGVEVELWCRKENVAEELVGAADTVKELDMRDFITWIDSWRHEDSFPAVTYEELPEHFSGERIETEDGCRYLMLKEPELGKATGVVFSQLLHEPILKLEAFSANALRTYFLRFLDEKFLC